MKKSGKGLGEMKQRTWRKEAKDKEKKERTWRYEAKGMKK